MHGRIDGAERGCEGSGRGLPWGLAVLLVGSSLAGCGGSDCTITDNPDGSSTISCGDGMEVTVREGMDGTSCTVRDDGMGSRIIECDDGTTVTVTDGMDGMQGMTGPDGTPGPDGNNALVTGPGLVIEVQEVGVDTDRRPYAVLRFTDGDGRPLDREGRLTQGAISPRFTIAHLSIESRLDGDVVLPYQSYLTREVTSATSSDTATQPATDSDGTWTVVDPVERVYRYEFEAVLPDTYDPTETHTIGIYATRTVDDVRYVANAVPNFRPDGMDVTVTRDIVSNDACNTCHTPLAFHGDSREDVRLCGTCHGDGYADPETGNSIDFRTLIHRIHRGSELPSVQNGVPYQIIGYRGRTYDYSTVVWPQDVRNCDTCHAGPDGDRWTTVPSRAACGACHDDIWFEAGDPPETWMRLHPGGDRPDDDRCTACHEASGGLSPIPDRHFTRQQLPDALDVDITVNSVTLPASRRILIDFTVTVDGAGRDIVTDPLNRTRFTLAGPTTDYAFSARYDTASVGTLTAVDASAGRFTYEIPDTVEEIATANSVAVAGTWAVGVESREVSGSGERYPGPNVITNVAITDPTAVPRRQVVDIALCNACHIEIGQHGDSKNDPQYCAMCHNPNLDNVGRVPLPAPGDLATSTNVDFARLIHTVHTGEDAEGPYVLYSRSGEPETFDDNRFPADRRVCERCHVDEASYDLPLSADLLPRRTHVIDSTGGIVQTLFMAPTTAACVGCHSAPSTVAHAETMTTALGVEGCAACHASGSAFGVDVAHARPEYDWAE